MNGCRNWNYQWPLKKCWRNILLSHIEKGSVIYSRKNLIKQTSLLTTYHCFEVRKLGYRTDESTVWARARMCMCTTISFSQVFKCPVQISSFLFFFKPRFDRPGWLRGWVSAFSPRRDPRIQDWVLHRAPCMEPASPSAWVFAPLFVCLSWINK